MVEIHEIKIIVFVDINYNASDSSIDLHNTIENYLLKDLEQTFRRKNINN